MSPRAAMRGAALAFAEGRLFTKDTSGVAAATWRAAFHPPARYGVQVLYAFSHR